MDRSRSGISLKYLSSKLINLQLFAYVFLLTAFPRVIDTFSSKIHNFFPHLSGCYSSRQCVYDYGEKCIQR